MKKLMMILAMALLALSSTSCLDFRDELDELHSEIDALKTEMSRINQSVDALSSIVNALQSGIYVKSVTPLQENGSQVGYVITFSDGSQATLRNGKDGADGKDGSDGHTPVIGVRKDSDGIYYWTVDGNWLLDNGKKLPVTGNDGADGIAPQLKTEGGYWYISYDEGVTWEQLDKCNGSDGRDGDSFFQNVDVTDPSFIIITLIDGTEIKLPTWDAFEALHKQVDEMNTNVAGLQRLISQIQNGGYVTKYEVITESGAAVGYILYFADGTKAEIRDGKDGTDGADGRDGADGKDGTDGADGKDGTDGTDGKDGHTPVIGVKASTDGILYWTIDGEWLLSDGKKVPVTGGDGRDGQDGSDGVTPQIGIDDGGYWIVSVDGGKTWSQILSSDGEPMPSTGAAGKDGKDGKDGDSLFSSVTLDSEHNFISFTLADGQSFDVPYYSSLAVTFDPDSVVINGTETVTVNYKIMNGGDDPVIYVMQNPSDDYFFEITESSSDAGTITISCPTGYAEPSEAIILFSSATSSIAKRLPVSVNYVGSDYVKVTEDLGDWTGTYILVDEGYKAIFVDVDLTDIESGRAKAKPVIFAEDGTISTSDNPDIAECELTITKVEDKYYSVTTSSCVKIGASQSGHLNSGDDILNQIIFKSGDGAKILNKDGSLRIRYNLDIKAFRYYAEISQVGDGVLYRKVTTDSTTK